ncbi:S1 family peptidase [Candidatus Dojkabacteria bacterium]|uniref:S1 family peptidase n=1 Tax=Candidatus Dojkabacteria bacterium TaxID=2099670 RepID=A0A955L7Z2_9BACT|nr:S1 family peptidase [Candidatus Dojkabacteria bacterium]
MRIIKHSKKSNLLLVALLFGAFLLFTLSLSFELRRDDVSPEDSSALYGGIVENNLHPYAGYLIAYGANSSASICGTTYLTSNLAVSASHCFTDKVSAYLGYSLFDFALDQNFLARDVILHSGWDGANVDSDIAVIRLPDDFYEIEEYASIASPKRGCGYEVLGYGRTETDSQRSQLDKLRKRADFCITEIEAKTLTLRGENGGVCFGDSGSPVFEKGTNNIVGIISSIITTSESTDDPCSIGNRAIAVRVDVNTGFINSAQSFSFNENNVAVCGESCSVKGCAFGLVCDRATNTCENLSGSCTASYQEYCSEVAAIECTEGNECSLNRCEVAGTIDSTEQVLQTNIQIDISPELEQAQTYARWRNYSFYAAVAFVAGVVVVWALKKIFRL